MSDLCVINARLVPGQQFYDKGPFKKFNNSRKRKLAGGGGVTKMNTDFLF